MNKSLYEKAAKAAYSNCLELLQDANVLYNHKRYARAVALGVLSCEEFAKAFLYKCIACGIVLDRNFQKDLIKHELKLSHFIHLIVIGYVWSIIGSDVAKAVEHDKNFKEHSKHVLPQVFDKAQETIDITPLINVFKYSHAAKMRTIYVDVKRGKILLPNDAVKKRGCHAFLYFLNSYLHGFDIILSEDEKTFRKTVKWLDPDILSGKIKADYKRE